MVCLSIGHRRPVLLRLDFIIASGDYLKIRNKIIDSYASYHNNDDDSDMIIHFIHSNSDNNQYKYL